MKIRSVEPIVLGGQYVLVRITADDGAVGFGECSPMNAPIVSAVIEHAIAPLVVGENPFAIEALCERVAIGTYKIEGRLLAIALSGVELALWDLKGKALGVPAYELLGGIVRDRVPVYATITRDAPLAMARRAAVCVEHGFRAVKIMISTIWGFDSSDDTSVEVVREVRSAVGNDIVVMLDANSAWTLPTAIAMCRRLSAFDIRYIEQPVPERDLASLATVRSAGGIPVTFGEEEWSLWRFKDAIVAGAADFVQPDPIKAGGLLACKKIATLAEAFSRDCVPHNTQVNLGFAAMLQLVASTPNCRGPQECWILPDTAPDPLRDNLLQEPFRIVGGAVDVPRSPGLGVNINHEIVERYRNVSAPVRWPGAGAALGRTGVPDVRRQEPRQ